MWKRRLYLVPLTLSLVWLTLSGADCAEKPEALDPVPLLIQALKVGNARLRLKAAYELRNYPDPRALEPLIEALKDSNPEVRTKSVGALGPIVDSHATEPLIEALEDAEWPTRLTAATSLGEIGDPRGIDPFLRLFKG
ncbi:HEAT repeat domain-containing protein [candidate division WOR-3 bacterium]|nr:HEAT repeat domain-containing protein [candidate division WOR-3 bacterium]